MENASKLGGLFVPVPCPDSPLWSITHRAFTERGMVAGAKREEIGSGAQESHNRTEEEAADTWEMEKLGIVVERIGSNLILLKELRGQWKLPGELEESGKTCIGGGH